MMLLFTKTKISFSLNWSKVKSQDHSVQVMVQLFWVVCWELMTSGYSLAYKATEKDNFLKNMSRNLWSKSNFLAEHLPQSSQILHSPSEAYQKCTAQRGAQLLLLLPNRDGSQEQAAVRTSTRILLGLLFCSGTVLGKRAGGSRSISQLFPSPRVWNISLKHCTVHVHKIWFRSKEGLQHLSLFSHYRNITLHSSWKGWRASPPT